MISTTKPTLVIVCETFKDDSGWGRIALWTAKAALMQGYSVFIASADRNQVAIPGTISSPPVFSMHEGLKTKVLSTIRWWKWMRTLPKETIIHFVSEPQFLLNLGLKQPTFGILCGTYARIETHGSWLNQLFFRLGMNRMKHLFPISHYTQAQMTQDWRSNTTVIPLGISQELTQEPFTSINWEETKTIRIISVGAVKARKGFRELIHGFALFHKTHPDSVLAIVGMYEPESEYVKEVQQLISNLQLETCVKLTGSVSSSELYGWYRWSTLLALTSIDSQRSFEGFGLVFLEANAFGKPTLGVRNTGNEQAVCADSGMLIDSTSPEAIATGLEQVVKKSNWDFSGWIKRHDWQVIFQEYEKAYHRFNAK